MSKALVLYSGGMDSAVILSQAVQYHEEVTALTFFYGQRHQKELEYAKKAVSRYGIHHVFCDITSYGNLIAGGTSLLTSSEKEIPTIQETIGHPQPITYVPNRNMVLLSIAGGYAETIGAKSLYTAIVALDNLSGYYDCTQPFIDAINAVFALNRMHKIEVKSPLVTLTKKEIILLGIQNKVPFEDTWTCYKGEEKACGTCPACAGRIKGFIEAGFMDPMPYQIEIPWKERSCVALPEVLS